MVEMMKYYRLGGNTIHVVSVVFEHEHDQLVAWREESGS